MKQLKQQCQPAFGSVADDTDQIAYTTAMYQPASAVAGVPQATTPLSFLASHQLANRQQQLLRVFFANQMLQITKITDFKTHCVPLARIKKIMRADEDVNMISVDAPVVFAKACEFFIFELTLRSWIHAEKERRKTLLKNDVTVALNSSDIYDFLFKSVSEDELKDESFEGVASAAFTRIGPPAYQMAGAGMMIGNPAHQMASFAVPPPQSAGQMAGAGMMIGNPAHQMASYAVPPAQPAVQMAGAGMMIGNPAHQMASYAVPPPQSYAVPPTQSAGDMTGAGMMIGNLEHLMASYPVTPLQSAVHMAGAGMMTGDPAHQMDLYDVPPPHSTSYLLPQPQAQQQATRQQSARQQSNPLFGDVQWSPQ